MSKPNKNIKPDFYNKVVELLQQARKSVVQTINRTMTYTYFEIGRIIVEEEQKGNIRADYGKNIIKDLSKNLTKEFGKGFSVRNIEQMRKFYIVYRKRYTLPSNEKKTQTLSAISANSIPEFKLSWSHYLFLMRINNKDERLFYEKEAIENHWSLRELKRQFNSALYERLAFT